MGIKLLHIIKAQASQATIEITAGAINADCLVAAPYFNRLGFLEVAGGRVTENKSEAFGDGVAFIPTLPNGKLTLIVIAHRQNTIEKCDQIINLSDAG